MRIPTHAAGPEQADLGQDDRQSHPSQVWEEAVPSLQPLRRQPQVPHLRLHHSLRGLDGVRGRQSAAHGLQCKSARSGSPGSRGRPRCGHPHRTLPPQIQNRPPLRLHGGRLHLRHLHAPHRPLARLRRRGPGGPQGPRLQPAGPRQHPLGGQGLDFVSAHSEAVV